MINKTTKTEWLLESITIDDTIENKLIFLAEKIRDEAFYPYNIKKFRGNKQAIIADHLMGLPSYLNIPFYNDDIFTLLRSWGYQLKTDASMDRALENYWSGVAMIILAAFKKYKIEGII